MNMNPVILLFAAGFASSVSMFSGTAITVRLINGELGQGMSGKSIWLYLGPPSALSTPLLKAITGSDGTAIFPLADLPAKEVFVYTASAVSQCSSIKSKAVSTEEILKYGVLGDDNCDHTGRIKARFRVKPGEVIIFAKELKRWQTGAT